MSYNKKTWTGESYLVPSDMNNIENGIATADSQLNGITTLTSGNLNNIVTTGTYYISAAASNSISNVPAAGQRTIVDVIGNGSYTQQIAQTYDGRKFMRSAFDGSFGTWQQLALNADLTKNRNLGSGINIKTYTSSNRYTCPSDGYIRVVHYGRSSGYVNVRIESDTNGNYTQFSTFANSQGDAWNTIYVRKGLKVYPNGSSGDYTLAFIPIE